jgi:hypothetical protein
MKKPFKLATDLSKFKHKLDFWTAKRFNGKNVQSIPCQSKDLKLGFK